MAIRTNLFPCNKCGKDVTSNVYINEARRESKLGEGKMQSDWGLPWMRGACCNSKINKIYL